MPVNHALTEFKPDAEEAAQRWQAFYAGELIDRPPVVVTAPRRGQVQSTPVTYRERAFGDLKQVVENVLEAARATFWGGEAFPSFYPGFGPDEIAVFCGCELRWNPESGDTNWSVPFVEDWRAALPLRLDAGQALWQRMLDLYGLASEIFAGRVLLVSPDLHTNMDLLAAVRGPQRLCLDTYDCPELLDRAMTSSRAIFRQVWSALTAAGRMVDHGFCLESHGLFSQEGAATLQCDFSIMLSPAMFRRWVLPALEEEAQLVKHVVYHWDGPGALVHRADLLASPYLHTLSFVPGDGNRDPVDHLELLKSLQKGGKAIHVWGTPEACKRMHRELMPDKVFYCTHTETQSEAEELLEWFTRHT